MGELLCVLTDEYWWFVLHDKQKFKKDGQEWKWETPDTPQAGRLHKLVILYHYIWHQTCLEVHDTDTDLSKP